MWEIKQATRASKQARNLEQFTVAKALQVYINSNLKEGVPKIEDLAAFLPHPLEYQLQSRGRNLDITSRSAKDFLGTYETLPIKIVAVFESWVEEIKLIASI